MSYKKIKQGILPVCACLPAYEFVCVLASERPCVRASVRACNEYPVLCVIHLLSETRYNLIFKNN